MQTVKTGFGMGNVNASTSSFYLSVVALTQKCYQGRDEQAWMGNVVYNLSLPASV